MVVRLVRSEAPVCAASTVNLKRVVVVGISGAGKSTTARAITAHAGGEHIELDALFWGPNWTPKPEATFKSLVANAIASERWVVDGNYSVIREIVWPQATTVVWLNLSFPVVFWQVLRRTLIRAFNHQELWQGNRESIRRSFFSKESILWWVITAYRRRQSEFARLQRDAIYPHLSWIELRNRDEVDAFLASLH